MMVNYKLLENSLNNCSAPQDCKDKNSCNAVNGRNGEYARDISTSAIYPVAGALLGTCLGGPVGLLAGVKIGGLAAIGGSVFGKLLKF